MKNTREDSNLIMYGLFLKVLRNANDNMKTPAAFQGEGRNVTSSSSFSINTESSSFPGMNSIDLNMDSEDANFSLSSRPMGLKKSKAKTTIWRTVKQLLEQNDKLIKAITKGTSERNKIQSQKIEVARTKEENKILFADLNS